MAKPIALCSVLFLLAAPAAFAAAMEVDATGCLSITKSGPSATCTTKSSLNVELTNTCKIPIRAQLCLRGGSHLWVQCASADSLAPKQTFFANTCDADGAFTYWGCSKFSATSGNCGGNGLVGKSTNASK